MKISALQHFLRNVQDDQMTPPPLLNGDVLVCVMNGIWFS